MMHTRNCFSAMIGLLVVAAVSPFASGQIVGGLGPSVMSRGGNAPGGRGNEQVDFTFYGGVQGTYQNGLIAPIIDSQGKAENVSLEGVSLNVGAYGSHTWRRSSFGMDYRGDYQHYTNNHYYNGSDHALGMEFRHVINRRWEVAVREVGGTSTRPFGGYTAPVFMATDYLSVPTTEIYNNRIYYLQTTGYASYRKSARTMYTMGGGGFATYRQSHALVNTNAAYAIGSVEHLLSRNFSVGASYNYMRFTYPRAFGQSDIHGATLDLSRSLGRRSAFRVSGGAYRVETLGNEQFALSAEIAAILGRSTGTRVFHRVSYLPQFALTFTHRRQTTSYNVGYTRGATPGNGLYLTSQSDIMSAGVSYSGIRKISFGVNTSYQRMRSLAQSIPDYSRWSAGGGAGWAIGHGLNFTLQADWRRLTAGSTITNQNGVYVSAGLAFSSSPLPISLW